MAGRRDATATDAVLPAPRAFIAPMGHLGRHITTVTTTDDRTNVDLDE